MLYVGSRMKVQSSDTVVVVSNGHLWLSLIAMIVACTSAAWAVDSSGRGAIAPGASRSLADKISSSQVILPGPLEASIASWGTWGSTTLSPRLYQAPLTDQTMLIGWTDSQGDGHVSIVDLTDPPGVSMNHTFSGLRVKGLVAHDDGTYAVLLWSPQAATMTLSKRSPTGALIWSCPLDASTTEFDDWLGDARLTYGDGRYAAYYTVYGIGSWMQGHHGDQLRYVSDAGTMLGGGWVWGCSHSMAELIGWSQNLGFTALCSSDCYPSAGLVQDNSDLLLAADGDCGGLVSLQLGQLAAGRTEWKAVVNAMSRTCCAGHGIGFVRFGGAAGTALVWFTSTDGIYERDPVIARLPDAGVTERYLVGWRTTNDGQAHIGVVNGSGVFLEGPESVPASSLLWGVRDDSFRTWPDGSIGWLWGAAGSTTVTLYRYTEAAVFSDGFESGQTSGWSSTVP